MGPELARQPHTAHPRYLQQHPTEFQHNGRGAGVVCEEVRARVPAVFGRLSERANLFTRRDRTFAIVL